VVASLGIIFHFIQQETSAAALASDLVWFSILLSHVEKLMKILGPSLSFVGGSTSVHEAFAETR